MPEAPSAVGEDLAERRHRRAGGGAERVAVRWHVSPTQNVDALRGRRLLECGDLFGFAPNLEERDAHRIRAHLWKFKVDNLAEERVGNLREDARRRHPSRSRRQLRRGAQGSSVR